MARAQATKKRTKQSSGVSSAPLKTSTHTGQFKTTKAGIPGGDVLGAIDEALSGSSDLKEELAREWEAKRSSCCGSNCCDSDDGY